MGESEIFHHTYESANSGIVAILLQLGSIVLAQFESELRESITGVPTMKIQSYALLNVFDIAVRCWLIEQIRSNKHSKVILCH